ncbi:MAG: hypothetical protein RJA63_4141 [Pseudomonadota bacterium]|jgi:hypothetical protein
MKKALTRLATTLMGALSANEPVSDVEIENRCDDIREAMLTLIDQCGRNAATEAVSNRVCYAKNIEALWYLRTAVMVHVTQVAGETEAHAQLARITWMFRGYLPAGLGPRSRARTRSVK